LADLSVSFFAYFFSDKKTSGHSKIFPQNSGIEGANKNKGFIKTGFD